jgi:hypothetical protein
MLKTCPPDGNFHFGREINIALKKWQQEGDLHHLRRSLPIFFALMRTVKD